MKNIQNILKTKFQEKQYSNENGERSDRAVRREKQRLRKSFDNKISFIVFQEIGDKYWYSSLSDETKNEIWADWTYSKRESVKVPIDDYFKNFCKLKYNSINPNKTIYRDSKINDLLK